MLNRAEKRLAQLAFVVGQTLALASTFVQGPMVVALLVERTFLSARRRSNKMAILVLAESWAQLLEYHVLAANLSGPNSATLLEVRLAVLANLAAER